jgi:general secretion pathway protein C
LEAIPAEMINIPRLSAGPGNIAIDITPVLGSGIFGGDPDTLEDEGGAATIDSGREGIEQNAKETRLALVLTGIVASTEDGLGSAVIKGGSREQVYAVGDDLPVSGKVTLVKVMPRQVVIDNSGTYELIKLYEGPGLVLPDPSSAKGRARIRRRLPRRNRPATIQSLMSRRGRLWLGSIGSSSMRRLNPLLALSRFLRYGRGAVSLDTV